MVAQGSAPVHLKLLQRKRLPDAAFAGPSDVASRPSGAASSGASNDLRDAAVELRLDDLPESPFNPATQLRPGRARGTRRLHQGRGPDPRAARAPDRASAPSKESRLDRRPRKSSFGHRRLRGAARRRLSATRSCRERAQRRNVPRFVQHVLSDRCHANLRSRTTGRCRTNLNAPGPARASATRRPNANGRFQARRSQAGGPAVDPKEPVAIFWVNDRSTLELDRRRSRRANLSWRLRSFAPPTPATSSRQNGCIRK
jgi:hypothetical protein